MGIGQIRSKCHRLTELLQSLGVPSGTSQLRALSNKLLRLLFLICAAIQKEHNGSQKQRRQFLQATAASKCLLENWRQRGRPLGEWRKSSLPSLPRSYADNGTPRALFRRIGTIAVMQFFTVSDVTGNLRDTGFSTTSPATLTQPACCEQIVRSACLRSSAAAAVSQPIDRGALRPAEAGGGNSPKTSGRTCRSDVIALEQRHGTAALISTATG
jgi:hypothetical protein